MRTRADARHQLVTHGVPLGQDYHTLNSETVDRIIAAADAHGYRKNKNAPGSRARMFYQYAGR